MDRPLTTSRTGIAREEMARGDFQGSVSFRVDCMIERSTYLIRLTPQIQHEITREVYEGLSKFSAKSGKEDQIPVAPPDFTIDHIRITIFNP